MTATHSRDTLLVFSQVYPPDPAAVGQHLADAAEEMRRRGWRVVVCTARRGYDDPSVRYPSRETRAGVDVRRLPLSSFGKSSIAVRLGAQSLFMAQAVLRGLFTRRLAGILVSTSPPFAGFGGTLVSWIRGVPLVWWAMDINPDQMVTSGRIGERSLVARVFDWMNRQTLGRSRAVIVLDDYMKERMRRKAEVGDRLHVIPPWPLENHLEVVPHEANPFRQRHGLQGRFVVMYSGNAGYSTPLATLLAAAKRLEDVDDLRFVFIGGGVVKREIDEMAARDRPPNILSLPYQPLETIRYSLSAGDLHVVSIANEGVGVVHPCKIYGAMALGKPVLALAPPQSHAAEIVREHGCGWAVPHGDVDALTAILRGILESPRENLEAMGRTARHAVDTRFSHDRLLGRLCDVIESSMRSVAEHRP
jgi:colanic acid biosynthesis glycosyl transferase WcaI